MNAIGGAHHLHHLGDGVHAHDVRAGQHGGGHRRRGAPVALGRRTLADRVAHERFARWPDENRPVDERGQLREPGQHTIAVRCLFGKPDARVDDHAVERHPGLGGGPQAYAELGRDLADQVVVHRFGVHRLGAAAGVHHDERGTEAGDHASQRRIIT